MFDGTVKHAWTHLINMNPKISYLDDFLLSCLH